LVKHTENNRNRKQETGNRKQETGYKRQVNKETRNRIQGIKKETRNRIQETGKIKYIQQDSVTNLVVLCKRF